MSTKKTKKFNGKIYHLDMDYLYEDVAKKRVNHLKSIGYNVRIVKPKSWNGGGIIYKRKK